MRARTTSVVLAGVLLAALTGCTFTAPQTVQDPYDPSDGVGATVGSVQIRNALLITEDGQTGNFLVSLVNTGSESVSMDFSWEDSSGTSDRTVEIDAGATETLGVSADQNLLENLDTEPGSLLPIYFQYGDNEGNELLVPVLDGSLPEYSALVPEDQVPSELVEEDENTDDQDADPDVAEDAE